MKKIDKVKNEILLKKQEISRLEDLLLIVDGVDNGVCPECKTPNLIWNTIDIWSCAFCGICVKGYSQSSDFKNK
jgi:ribosomal protein L37AE/L43A